MRRRDFLATAATVGIAATFNSSVQTAQSAEWSASAPTDQRAKAKFRLCSQLRGWIPGKTDVEKMAQMKKWGMEAVEFHSNVLDNPKEFKKKADDAGLKVSVICGGTQRDKLASPDPEVRKEGMDHAKQLLEAAAVLECNGVIHVPTFNKDWPYKNMTATEIRNMMIDIDPNTRQVKGGQIKELGDFAASLKTNIILEPLNRKEAWILRQIADAASICRDCQSEGVKTMGDFYHMYYEETCDMGAFICGGKYVKHVHFGCGNKRVLPGQDPEGHNDFVSGFRGLKFIGYQEFMSFECGCLGGDDKGAVEVPKTLEFLRKSWEEA